MPRQAHKTFVRGDLPGHLGEAPSRKRDHKTKGAGVFATVAPDLARIDTES